MKLQKCPLADIKIRIISKQSNIYFADEQKKILPLLVANMVVSYIKSEKFEKIIEFCLKNVWSGATVRKSCRSRQLLQNEYSLQKPASTRTLTLTLRGRLKRSPRGQRSDPRAWGAHGKGRFLPKAFRRLFTAI